MIARIWHGRVPLEKSEEYLEKMRSVALPDYERTPGNRGAYCLHRVDGTLAYFQMLTFWDDIDAIKRFAGEDYHQARYYGQEQQHPDHLQRGVGFRIYLGALLIAQIILDGD